MKILYFSLVNWKWIKQRPQFLCEHFCKLGNTVEYLSVIPLLKARAFKSSLENGLKIRDIYVIPLSLKFKLVENMNIAYVKRKLAQDYDVIILTHPFQYKYIPEKFKSNSKVVYDCMDNLSCFNKGKISRRIYKEEAILCRSCNKIITSSNYLKNRIINEYKVPEHKITVIKNAVDESFFKQKPIKLELKHPNLIYIGTISEWLDFENIINFARNNPSITIYLIGPCQININCMIKEIKNIIYVPAIEHKQVADYIYSADILLIPFIVNDLIRGVDPVKMYEYLSMNKQVVSSFWDEVSVYKNYENVHFYDSYETFLQSVNVALTMKHVESETLYNETFARDNSWEARAIRFIESITK